MNYFLLDAPVFVARYTLGAGYSLADHFFTPALRDRLFCSVISITQVMAALVRLRRRGLLTPVLFAGASLQFRLEVLQSASIMKLPLDAPAAVASLALIDKHRLDGYSGILLHMCLDQALHLRPGGLGG